MKININVFLRALLASSLALLSLANIHAMPPIPGAGFLFTNEFGQDIVFRKIGGSEVEVYGNCMEENPIGFTTNEGDLIIPPKANGYTVTRIGVDAFYHSYINSLSIPATVDSICKNAFYMNKTITAFHVDSNNQWFKDIDGVLYSKNGKKLRYYPFGRTSETYEIPDSVEAIGREAFAYGKGLEHLNIGPNIKSLGERCFYESGIKEVNILGNCLSIGKECFCDCENLEKVSLPESLEFLPEDVFCRCNHLNEVNIPSNLKKIGDGAFRSTNIRELEFPEYIEEIGRFAFLKTPLAKAVVPDGADSLELDRAFLCAKFLEELSVGDNVKKLTFRENDKLMKLSFGKAMERVKFEDCPPMLIEINSRAWTAPDLEITFSGKPSPLQVKLCKIHVPTGSKESYVKKGWELFGTIVDDIEVAGIFDATAEGDFAPYEICEVYRPTGEKLADSIQFKDIPALAAKGIVIVRSPATGQTVKTVVN